MSFASLGDLPDPGIEPMSPALAGGFFTTVPLGKYRKLYSIVYDKLQWKRIFLKKNILYIHITESLCSTAQFKTTL